MFTNHPVQGTNNVQHARLSKRTMSYQKNDISIDYFTSQTTEDTHKEKHQKQKREIVPFLIFSFLTIMRINPYVDYDKSKFENLTIVRKIVPYGTILRRKNSNAIGRKTHRIHCQLCYTVSKRMVTKTGHTLI